MNSNEIQARQNEEILLKVQHAARVCFNSAEKYNHFAWIACLVSAFSVFLSNSWPMYIIYGIPFAADILAFAFSLITSYQVNWASTLRKYFDSYVLNIQLNQFSETELCEIREQTEKIYLRNPINAAIQMANTGNASPPGVRDWYVFSKFYDGINAQFECQRQNTWWNSKMVTVRIITTFFMLILVGIIFLFFLLNNSILNILLCSAGILIKICERIIENWRYFRISRLIDGSQQTIEVHPTAEGIEKLQNLIDKRRSINVLELGWLHNKLANKFSKLYENIIS
jgi:hypothetical protein